MSSPAKVIQDLLVTASIGAIAGTSGWALHLAKEPAQGTSVPYTCITIYDTGGLRPNPQWLLDEPTCQVRVRGNPGDYLGAFQKAEDVKNLLLGLPSQTIGADRWVSVSMLSDITSIGYNEQNCPLLTMNLKIIIEPASGTNRTSL